MHSEILNIGLAFLEGIALIISPCILPILPIVLAGSLEGSKRRPIGILIGFVLSFSLFTFFARKLVLWFNFDLLIIRNVSFILLISFGLIMLSDYLSEKFAEITAKIANTGVNLIQKTNDYNLSSGLLFGVLIGLIWTPCAGPILAAVIVQSVLQQSNFSSFLTLLAFGLGSAIPMGLIIVFGRSLLIKFNLLQTKATLIRKIVGLIIILAVAGMIFGLPFFNMQVEEQGDISGAELKNALIMDYIAPDFTDISAWINSEPLTMAQLRGKVVLIDFWAYSCINCIRTLPYLKDWYNKYKDHGLVIVGVHSPEFDFERSKQNVQDAVQTFEIKYPVALDNNFATWKAYANHYWPAHYLIDKNGAVVYEHFGEGQYATTENNIRYLLNLEPEDEAPEPSTRFTPRTPETYLGYSRIDGFASLESIEADQIVDYRYPHLLPENYWSLKGKWIIAAQKIISQEHNAAIKLHFYAKNVFAVMGSNTNAPIKVKALYKGAVLNNTDVFNGSIEVKGYKLYNLISLPTSEGGELELIADQAGLEIYTFTFGS